MVNVRSPVIRSGSDRSSVGPPRFRRIRKAVEAILENHDREEALASLSRYEDRSVVGPLFSCFYSQKDEIRFRSAVAMGVLTCRIERGSREKARIVLRRLMWNLNDESGGIGWGSCEAMGEILSRSERLAEEFGSVLLSYIDPRGNFLEHDMLQRGVLWGVGTYAGVMDTVDRQTVSHLERFLFSPDAVKRGYAVRALTRCRERNYRFPERVFRDRETVPVFDGWNMTDVTVSELARSGQPLRF